MLEQKRILQRNRDGKIRESGSLLASLSRSFPAGAKRPHSVKVRVAK
jgi:hypothetical protein